MSIGTTHRGAYQPPGLRGEPRDSAQIYAEALERTQDEESRRATARAHALAGALVRLNPSSVVGLCVRHQDLDIVLSCDDADTWRAHYEPHDPDGFPIDDEPVRVGEGPSPKAALDAVVALLDDPEESP